MQSRRLLLDGPDLQALLRRAEEVGGRVVRARRHRRGLLGRSWYEVTVDVPDTSRGTPPPPGPPARRRRPAGLGDLLAAAEAAERAEATVVHAARTAEEQRGR